MARSMVATRRVASAVARSDAVPDAPDVFPALPADAVEECELQIVRLVCASSDRKCSPCGAVRATCICRPWERIGYWYWPHVITFQASASSDGPPSGSNASGCPILSAAMRKRERHSVLRVAVDSVGPDFRHQFRNRIGPRLAGIARALVPHHHRKQHFHAAPVEIRDHLPHAGDATRHGCGSGRAGCGCRCPCSDRSARSAPSRFRRSVFPDRRDSGRRCTCARPDRRNSGPPPSSAAG